MKAVILAAGEGLRLRPLTHSKPKVLLPVANKPILQYVIEAVAQNNAREIVIVVGYKKEKIRSYFEDGKRFGVNIEYVHQKKQLGTAHALNQTGDLVDEPFLVVAGDNIIRRETIAPLITCKKTSLLITESDRPSKYGTVVIEKNRLKKIVEKPQTKISNLISTGAYLFSPRIFGEIDASKENALTPVIQHMLRNGDEIKCLHTDGLWADVVYPWDLLRVNAELLSGCATGVGGLIEKNVVIKGQVSIGKDTIIRAGSYIVGPTVIGDQCEIGPNTCIFPSTSIGNNVTIKPFSEIKNSIIMADVRIGTSSVISNSMISNGAMIGPNFINEADRAFVQLIDGFHDVEKIGATIGEDACIGNSVSIHAGKIVGANCKIAPKTRITANISDDTTVA